MKALNKEQCKKLNALNNQPVDNSPYVIFYSLSDYNNGVLIPFCIDLDINNTNEEMLTAISESLETITDIFNDGEIREEYIVCDVENIPGEYVGEWSIDSNFFEYQAAINDSYLDKEVFEAGIDCGIPFESIEDVYQGEYKDNEDFAYEMAESCGLIDDNAKWPYCCIDWSHAARELMYDFVDSNGHYFSNNY